MPTRLIREGILTSERVNSLDPAAEVFYRRLLSKVDDFGLFDARPAILLSALYPLQLAKVREANIVRWLADVQTANLVRLYEVASKPYLQVLDTRWPTRSSPKYPPPPDGIGEQPSTTENSCAQLRPYSDANAQSDSKAGAHSAPAPGRRRLWDKPAAQSA